MNSSFLTSRPQYKGCDVITTLADFAIITYAVEPSVLAQYLPANFEPDIFTLANGSQRAFVSAVPFRDLDFRFAGLPWFKFSFGQTNYRAYVKYEGTRCVWFFGTSLATPFVNIPRHVWQLPWHWAAMSFATQWQEGRCRQYCLATQSSGANVELELTADSEPMGVLDGFSSEEQTAEVLTHPLTGYFYRRDGKVGRYSVWHERLQLSRATASRARFQLFEELGLITADTPIHSALVQQATEFVVILPPQVVV